MLIKILTSKQYKALQEENQRLKEENAELIERAKWNAREQRRHNENMRNENAKLKCLSLHAMAEYCFAQGTITQLELTEQPVEEDAKMIRKVNIRDRWGEFFCKYYEAYRKAKKKLMEGK